MPSTCSGPTLGKNPDSPTSQAKAMTSFSKFRSCCIETPRKFPEPQAGFRTLTAAISSAKRPRRRLRSLFILVAQAPLAASLPRQPLGLLLDLGLSPAQRGHQHRLHHGEYVLPARVMSAQLRPLARV